MKTRYLIATNGDLSQLANQILKTMTELKFIPTNIYSKGNSLNGVEFEEVVFEHYELGVVVVHYHTKGNFEIKDTKNHLRGMAHGQLMLIQVPDDLATEIDGSFTPQSYIKLEDL